MQIFIITLYASLFISDPAILNRSEYFIHFLENAHKYEINTKKRAAHFWAQMLHETNRLKWIEERGNKRYFRKYDFKLGNKKRGEGYKYRGRGLIQITGKHNYRYYGKKVGIDLVKNPELAKKPEIAVKIAMEYWKMKDLNRFADKNDIKTITKRINGGYNGLKKRKFLLRRMLK